ncbi:MAG: flagellin [Phycisphaerales bacterium]
MSSIPSHFGRVPNLLASQIGLAHVQRTNTALFRANNQLSTGLAILRPSDDSVKAAAISTLDERLEATQQRLRNLSHAGSAMGVVDSTLAEVNDLMIAAKQIAQEQLNFGASPEERSQQALVVQSLIDSLFRHANEESVAGFVFGGSAAGQRPVEELLGGYRSRAVGNGLTTDLGPGQAIPLSLGASNPLVGTTARVNGSVDLDPTLTPETRLVHLAGARGLGITTGQIEFSIDGSESRRIDLTDADTISDVADRIAAALLQYEQDTGQDVLGPAGVALTADGLRIDVPAATPPATDPTITFSDIGVARVAANLGLTNSTGLAFTPTSTDSLPLEPRLSWLTPIDALAGIDTPLGAIRITNGGLARVVDLSGAETVEDIKRAIEAENIGLRVELDRDTGALVVIQELASAAGQGLSIVDVDDDSAGGFGTATALGIRTFGPDTRLASFNDSRGVSIVTGGKDPVTGLPDPDRDVDFDITLGNGTVISINLQPADILTVQTLIDAINAQAAPQLAADGLPPSAFEARLSVESGGIELAQDVAEPVITGPITVDARNGSRAAQDLGLLNRPYNATSGITLGDDRAQARNLNAFTALLDLREALETDDTIGIQLAGERIEQALDALNRTRGLFGGFDRRVGDLTLTEEDRQVLDESARSLLRDADFAEVASRFTLLQTQLQAGYQVLAQSSQLSLLDFLG